MSNSPTPNRLDVNDPRHGAPSGYRAGCRLACCRSAWSAYNVQLQQKRAAKQPEANPDLPHGVYTTAVNHRCPCPACLDVRLSANRDMQRARQWKKNGKIRVAGKYADEARAFIARMEAEG